METDTATTYEDHCADVARMPYRDLQLHIIRDHGAAMPPGRLQGTPHRALVAYHATLAPGVHP